MSDDYTPTQPENLSQLEFSQEHPQPGQRLLNQYEIFEIKQGGFGIVFLVTDLVTREKYAVKTYKPDFIDTLSSKEQFKAEVDFWISLDPHPNITQAYSVEYIGDHLYLFMEYVPGGTLRDLIKELDTNQAVNLAYQICLGMEHINKKGQKVHADLKPENILVTPENVAKVTDFGLSKFVKDLPRTSAGTLKYKSPEHFFEAVIDERSDIFSFGIMFYEMLTKCLPYPFETQGLPISGWYEELKNLYDNYTILYKMDDYRFTFWHKIQDISDVDERLKQLVITCILPYPGRRWQNFHQLCRKFKELLPGRIHYRAVDGEVAVADLHSTGRILHEIGQPNKALSFYNRALQKDPDNAELWRDAAYALIDVNRYSEALAFIVQAKNLNPNLEILSSTLQLLLNYLRGFKSLEHATNDENIFLILGADD